MADALFSLPTLKNELGELMTGNALKKVKEA